MNGVVDPTIENVEAEVIQLPSLKQKPPANVGLPVCLYLPCNKSLVDFPRFDILFDSITDIPSVPVFMSWELAIEAARSSA